MPQPASFPASLRRHNSSFDAQIGGFPAEGSRPGHDLWRLCANAEKFAPNFNGGVSPGGFDA
jgi:hypothetical protein